MLQTAPSACRTVFLHDSSDYAPYDLPSYRLLSDLGHEIVSAADADEAMTQVGERLTDLLLIDADRVSDAAAVLSRCADLPRECRPRSIVLFIDTLDASIEPLRSRVSPAKLSVLPRPLQMHGLLAALRKLDRHPPQPSVA